MKTDCEHRTDLDEQFLKDPVETLEEECKALKSEYLNSKDEETKNELVSKLFELASMYHEVKRDGEAHRVYGDIVHYDDSQARIIEIIRTMIPEDAAEEEKEDIKHRKLMALTAAAGEGAYSKRELGFE